jgi:rhodanese-related sulfurtransferase
VAADPCPEETRAEEDAVARSAYEFVEAAKATIEGVTPDQLAAELASGDVVVVDVRDSQEREHNGYIPGSIHIARVALEFVADPTSPFHDARLHPSGRVVVHCALGLGSALATARLKEMGYEEAANLEGGYEAWVAAGQQVEYSATARDRLLG